MLNNNDKIAIKNALSYNPKLLEIFADMQNGEEDYNIAEKYDMRISAVKVIRVNLLGITKTPKASFNAADIDAIIELLQENNNAKKVVALFKNMDIKDVEEVISLINLVNAVKRGKLPLYYKRAKNIKD